MKWSGGVRGWYYPTNKDGTGGKDYKKYTAKKYVFVYQKKTSYGNIISKVDRCVTDGNGVKYYYGFKSDNGDGVSNGRKKGCN